MGDKEMFALSRCLAVSSENNWQEKNEREKKLIWKLRPKDTRSTENTER